MDGRLVGKSKGLEIRGAAGNLADKSISDGTIPAPGQLPDFDIVGSVCYAPDCILYDTIRIPEMVANVTFSGQQKNRLVICRTAFVYELHLSRNVTEADESKQEIADGLSSVMPPRRTTLESQTL